MSDFDPDAFVNGRRFSELMAERRKTWTREVHDGHAAIYCEKHDYGWWAHSTVECFKCFCEVHDLEKREGWEKRRAAHAVLSDLPFTEPEPSSR